MQFSKYTEICKKNIGEIPNTIVDRHDITFFLGPNVQKIIS